MKTLNELLENGWKLRKVPFGESGKTIFVVITKGYEVAVYNTTDNCYAIPPFTVSEDKPEECPACHSEKVEPGGSGGFHCTICGCDYNIDKK